MVSFLVLHCGIKCNFLLNSFQINGFQVFEILVPSCITGTCISFIRFLIFISSCVHVIVEGNIARHFSILIPLSSSLEIHQNKSISRLSGNGIGNKEDDIQLLCQKLGFFPFGISMESSRRSRTGHTVHRPVFFVQLLAYQSVQPFTCQLDVKKYLVKNQTSLKLQCVVYLMASNSNKVIPQ